MVAAAVVAGAAVASVASTAMSGNAAMNAQKDAGAAANAQLQAGENQAISYQQPYMNLGTQASTQLGNSLTDLTTPVSMTQSQLEQTPGYQFQLSQGLKSTQNAQSALGLGVSGSSQKAAANYATGLANSNYQQQFSNAVTNQTNDFNRLMGVTGLGANASSTAGNAALGTASQIGNNLVGVGNAQAANYNAVGGSINNGLSSAGGFGASSALGYLA